MRQDRSKVEINLESLTSVAPFILSLDDDMTVVWMSEAALQRVEKAAGMKASELLELRDPPEKISKALLAEKIGVRCKLALLNKNSETPLVGRWLRSSNGFVILATPDAETVEDLSQFSFGDFPEGGHLVDMLVARDEAYHSLEEAHSAADALKRRNRELVESKRELDGKIDEIDEIDRQRRAILNMLKDIAESKRQLESMNITLEGEINERKKAEQRQDQLLKQLEKINQELKDFAYVVSHDLKAPLRGISTLANWISTDYADKLDDEGKEQLNLLVGRVDRMHNLIDGILHYSRIGRIKEEKVAVNLNKLVPDIIDMIAPPENITITVENELPTIKFEQTRIKQVFQNLLSNAVKYMDKPQGQIKVGYVEENGFCKFSVSDNGPGIEEQYFEKIFQMFQTLSPQDEVESTGIGLTLVKKIIEMYEGSIWVESELGKGSTFFFTLSKRKMGVKDAKLEASIIN